MTLNSFHYIDQLVTTSYAIVGNPDEPFIPETKSLASPQHPLQFTTTLKSVCSLSLAASPIVMK